MAEHSCLDCGKLLTGENHRCEAAPLAPGTTPYEAAVRLVREEDKVGISLVQRRLGVGYNQAARLIERMEAERVVSKPDMAGKRTVL